MLPIRLFTFGPGWGLPTTGPFGLKLEICLRMLDVPYERVIEPDLTKGPKRKSPWTEDAGTVVGDSELILAHVARTRGRALDPEPDPLKAARSRLLALALEEHFHQIYEYELLVRQEGLAVMRELLGARLPPEIADQALGRLSKHIEQHLFERGMGRHSPAEIEAKGRADVDALVALLGDADYFNGARPDKTDAAAFGLLAPAIRSGNAAPVSSYARAQPPLVTFVERMRTRFFPELCAAAA